MLKDLIEQDFEELGQVVGNISDPEDNDLLYKVVNKKLIGFDEDEVLSTIYKVHLDLLEKDPKRGDKILQVTDRFIENASKKFNTNNLQAELNKIKARTYLKVKVRNILWLPKKDISVSFYQNGKKIYERKTDEHGEIVLRNVPRKNLIIEVKLKNKSKEQTLELNSYYTEKNIFSLI